MRRPILIVPALALGLVGAGLALLAPACAGAQDHTEEARLHFEAGRAHYENGAYESALSEFETAYEQSGRVELLYNLYLTVERLGRMEAALDYLERFIAEGDHEPERLAQLEQRRENLRERMASQTDAETSETSTESTAPAPASGGDMLPAIIAFSVAGAGLLSFAIFGGLALAEDDRLAAGCGVNGTCSDAELSDLSTFSVVADVSWVTAAVAAAAGVVLLVTLGLPGDGGDAAFAPWVTPTAGGVSAVGRF